MSTKAAAKVDPRPQRTRTKLRTSLIKLALEKRWERIRVEDILQEANVGRSTFYSHFRNKFDLLHQTGCQLPFDSTPRGGPLEPDFLPLFTHIHADLALHQRLVHQHVHTELLEALQQDVAASLRDSLLTSGMAEPNARFCSDFISGGLARILINWTHDKNGRRPEDMCREFSAGATACIQAANASTVAPASRHLPS